MQTQKLSFTEKVFTALGQIKLSKSPLFLAYRPRSFALKGSQVREVMKKVQFGDVLVRSYNNYLDGFFIPGTFTHVGFYLGPVTEENLKKIAKVENTNTFHTGQQMVIHAIGNKVYLEDLIDFCRCDGLAIMRFPAQLKLTETRTVPEHLYAYLQDPTKAPAVESTTATVDEEEEEEATEKKKPKKAKKAKTEPPPSEEAPKLDAEALALVKAENDIVKYLSQGKTLEFSKTAQLLYRLALRELTMPSQYDFGITNFCGTNSTKLVYFITKSINWIYGIEAEPQKVFLKPRQVILPDMFVNNGLEEVWKEVY